jgi:release factor glutamine methyltransferase
MTVNQAFEILKKASDAKAAKIIFRHVFGLEANAPVFPDDKTISLKYWPAIFSAARKLRKGMPVAKITGKKWFYGIEFETGIKTLDPRPDSELLVELALKYSNHKQRTTNHVLDIGTGTGALICAIAKNSGITGVGIEKSTGALRVAQRNVKCLNLSDRIRIKRGDFNRPLKGDFDMIISNPPYIAVKDPRVDAGAKFDPKMALYAGANGLSAYRAIAKNARDCLNPGGHIILEIGVGQAVFVKDIFETAGWKFIAVEKDLSGIERAVVFMI